MSLVAACLTLLAGAPQAQASGPAPTRLAPGPEEPVAGIDGFFSRSRMLFPGHPELPHVLEAAYVFPDRARWHRKLLDSPPGVRDVEYRHGERVFALPQGSASSEELDPAPADLALLRLELRRAAMLWPAGFAWESDAEGGLRSEVLRSAGGEVIGTLEARVDPEGRPRELLARDRAAVAHDGLEITAWRTDGGRTWPAEMRWHYGGETTWTESVESVATQVRFLDVYFLPPDRRPSKADGPADRPRDPVASLDLVSMSYLRIPLDDGLDWDAAGTRHAAVRERVARDLGGVRALDPTPTFEVSEDGRPAALLVRLAVPLDPPPEGWKTLEERPGLAFLGLSAPPEAIAERLLLLGTRIPEGARPGIPYARLHDVRGARRLYLYLPLESRGSRD